MSWYRHDAEAADHPKVMRLARALGVRQAEAHGLIANLWCWALRFAIDGDMRSFAPEDVECGAKWEGDSGAFVSAAVDARLLDRDAEGGLSLHNWCKIQGSYREVQRKRDTRARQSQPCPGMSQDNPGMSQDSRARAQTGPDQTDKTDKTGPDQTDRPDSAAALWLRKIQEAGSQGRGPLFSDQSHRLLAIREQIAWADVLSAIADHKCQGKPWNYVIGYLERIATAPKPPGPALMTADQEQRRERDRQEAARQRAAMAPRTADEIAAGKAALAKIMTDVGGAFPGSTVEVQGEDGKE